MKQRVKDAFYAMWHVSLNHIRLTPDNIGEFALTPVFESQTVDVYVVRKRSKQKIFHVKDARFNKDRGVYVDWAEDDLKDYIKLVQDFESKKI